LSSALIFLGIALFAKGKRAGIWIIIIDFLMGLLLYANVVFYRANNDFITIPMLTQTSNFGSLGGSIASLVAWSDLFYLVDIIVCVEQTELVGFTHAKTQAIISTCSWCHCFYCESWTS